MKQLEGTFSQKESGFSLIELIIYLAILGILMTAVLLSFTQTIRNTATQTGIAETQIETGIGLDLLRADLEHAGFGLPWAFPGAIVYNEPAPMAAPNDIPRALNSADASALSLNTSDYLVIRATNVIRGVTGQKWGYVGRDINRNVAVQSMGATAFVNNDRVIVINPESSPGVLRELVMVGGGYVTGTTPATLTDGAFAPIATPNDPDGERFLVYGVDTAPDNNGVIRPFNRTDYFISQNLANRPTHCAPGTNVLVKATANQGNNNLAPMPIVDCVADAQIVYYLDANGDGGWDQIVGANGLNGLTAQDIRAQVKAIRYYILFHEGGIDRTYTHPNANVNVGVLDAAGGLVAGAGRAFNINAAVGANWANYRWKIESIAVTPKNLQ
jgi:prepilin-type N-terminal cleavage/methylation domain-containing protein